MGPKFHVITFQTFPRLVDTSPSNTSFNILSAFSKFIVSNSIVRMFLRCGCLVVFHSSFFFNLEDAFTKYAKIEKIVLEHGRLVLGGH